jgi:DNA-binding XRE family transcriptional regulator
MGHRKFDDIIGEIDETRRARIDTIKEEARADAVAFNLAELRRHRSLTQVELAKRLQRAQASISAMETADDNLLSTWRSVDAVAFNLAELRRHRSLTQVELAKRLQSISAMETADDNLLSTWAATSYSSQCSMMNGSRYPADHNDPTGRAEKSSSP